MLKNRIVAAATALTLAVAVTSAAQNRPANPTLTTQDYIDIQQLIARYAVAIDECTNNGYDYEDVYVKTAKGWLFRSRLHVLAPGQAEVSSGRKPDAQR
jgi:hypothetical protein